MTRIGQLATTEKPLLSRFVLLFMLVIFTVQGFALQTHIHGAPLSPDSHVTRMTMPSQPAPQDLYDSVHCPLCQEILHAGMYVAPVAADFIVILNAVAFAPAYALLPHAATERQHSWQGRAPPRP
jgi:hypothetical protein